MEEQSLKQTIMEILRNADESIPAYQGPNMMADGLIDSFILIQIIEELEDTFDIEIDAADMTVENFGNPESIIRYVGSLTGK